MKKQANVGFIGAGGFISAHHLVTANESEYLNIGAIADLNEDTLKRHAGNMTVGYTTTNYKDLLADKNLDIIVVGTKQDLHGDGIRFDIKGGIGQAVAKGIDDLLGGEGMEITVAHVDVFGINILVGVAEVAAGGIICTGVCNGVGQLAAGGGQAQKHLRGGQAAHHAALPKVQDAVCADFRQLRKLHDAAEVEQNHQSGEGGA